jgi:membrane fusion protein (multidrug efflux system)
MSCEKTRSWLSPSGGSCAPVLFFRLKAEATRRIIHSLLLMCLALPLAAQERRSVDVVPVAARVLMHTRTLPGELLPYESVPIHAKVSGFVQRVPVDRGSEVKRGQILLTIDAPEMTAQRAEVEAKLAAVRAQQVEAQAKLVGAQNTYDSLKAASATKGAVADNELVQAQKAVDAVRAAVGALDAQVRAAQAVVQTQQLLQSYLNVAAPFDGVITERNVHPGALVGPAGGNAPPLLRLENVKRLRLVVAVPEAGVAGITRGADIEFTVPAFPAVVFHGRVARPSASIDPKTRTMSVELDVMNADGKLAPGMYSDVRWSAHSGAQSLVVPKTSIVVTTERVFVIRVRGDRAEWVDVKRGLADKDVVEVFGDLKAGDEVVVRGTDEIRQGSMVAPRRVPATGS